MLGKLPVGGEGEFVTREGEYATSLHLLCRGRGWGGTGSELAVRTDSADAGPVTAELSFEGAGRARSGGEIAGGRRGGRSEIKEGEILFAGDVTKTEGEDENCDTKETN